MTDTGNHITVMAGQMTTVLDTVKDTRATQIERQEPLQGLQTKLNSLQVDVTALKTAQGEIKNILQQLLQKANQ